MTQQEAKFFFEPYIDWIRAVWHRGWTDYHKNICHPDDDSRTRSANIQNRAIIHAKQTCESVGVKHFTFNTRRLFRFGNVAILQFKKLTDDLLPMNNVNGTAEAFDAQESLHGLDDMPRLIAGYHPNELHTDYAIYLALPKSHYENNWILPISDDLDLTQFELPNEPNVPTSTPSRVRAKGATPQPSDDQSSTSA